jgi:hypothetical protein
MKCDSWASDLAHTFANPCLCHKPKARVVTSCEPILNIYILRDFQWYKNFFNPMNFDPLNRYLKIWDFIGILIHKMGVDLGLCEFIPSNFLT